MEGHLGTSSQYDTFGFTAAELARKQAEKEQKQRLHMLSHIKQFYFVCCVCVYISNY